MKVLKAGLLYSALVFGAGFVLGTIRVLWLVPQVGARTAELMETPVMIAVSIIAAAWTVRRLAVPPAGASRLGMGCLALGLLLSVESTFVLWLRDMSIREYFARLDPVSGTVYYVSLGVFTIMPLLVARSQPGRR